MEAIIAFKNGETITTEKNGDCFITSEVPVFPEDLSEVHVLEDGQERVLHYVMIQEAAAIDDRYWFALVEESAEDRAIRELEAKNRFLEDCLMEMSEIVYQ